MKRFFFATAAAVVVFFFLGAATRLPSDVRSMLERALAGERDAAARYAAFAAKAGEEGYPGAAALFRAQARAEATHAKRFAAAMKELEVDVPSDDPRTPAVGSTPDNLRAAAAAEASERDGMYREAAEACHRSGLDNLAKVFEQARDSETEHANLCNAASREVDALKQARTYYVCDGCGYTTDVKLGFCPVCRKREPLEGVH